MSTTVRQGLRVCQFNGPVSHSEVTPQSPPRKEVLEPVPEYCTVKSAEYGERARMRVACGSDADTEGWRCRGLRSDAVRNRTRILDAAQDMFAERGPEVVMDEIARRAGVGNATLYRHFSGRDALLTAVIERVATVGADAAEEAATQQDDPFTVLSRFVRAAARHRLASLCCLSGELAGNRPELVRQKDRLLHAAQLLLTRAQQAGRVRTDVSVEELMTALTQLGRPLPGVSWPATDQCSQRIVQLYLDGLHIQAQPEPAALPSSPSSHPAQRREASPGAQPQ